MIFPHSFILFLVATTVNKQPEERAERLAIAPVAIFLDFEINILHLLKDHVVEIYVCLRKVTNIYVTFKL